MNRSETVLVPSREPGGAGYLAAAPAPEYQSSVIDEIYAVMAQRPDAIALTDGDLEWTYAALRTRSDLVAQHLASRGVTHGSVVGMHLPRCADAIAVMLGIMVSGCVYLPLDPSYPPDRLRTMLDRADAAAVISPGPDPELYGADRDWLPAPSQLTAESAAPGGQPAPRPPIRAEDRAYILFTSGSTGEPKGVMVTHENITLMNEWSAGMLGFTSSDASATSCSLSFDPSFHEILLPLSRGGTVHVIPHVMALGQLTQPVSFIATTPTVATELLRAGQLPRLKALMLGGEKLAPDVAARLLSSGRVGTLLNCYGPTECTVCVTVAEVAAPVPGVIPVGRAVPGTQVLILDTGGRPLPDGEPGEICVFGRQVTPGYVNNPAATAERFALGPAGAAEPRRYYRTGDLGYRTDDGLVYFTGRADQQVKVNGIRIELGEIDAALRSHPLVSDAATIARDDGRIVGYVVAAEDTAVDAADLKKHVAQSLPRFMVPAGIVAVAELPKTVNGKLDTAALPHWSAERAEPASPGAGAGAGDVDEVTARVIQIVADVTGFAGPIRPADDFIDDLGGTSLGIVRVLVEFERDSGRRIRINDALADTSVAGLARLLREEAVSSPADFAFNTGGAAPPLFMIHSYLGGMLGLRRLAELLPPDQPVYGLQVYRGPGQTADKVTITALAADALRRMREIQPTGRITILGHSAGGLIAFEAARAIVAAGEPEPLVLLLDTARPYGTFGYYWGQFVLDWREIVRHYAQLIPAAVARRFGARWSGSRRLEATPQADDLVTLTERDLKSINAAVKSYKAQSYDGSLTIMSTRQGRIMTLGRRHLGWAPVTRGKVRIIEAPGAHVNMLDAPHIHTLTTRLVNWLSGK